MSSWMDALLALDRMICITFPRRFKFFKLKKVLMPIILTMFAFILAVHYQDTAYTLIYSTRYLNEEGGIVSNNQTLVDQIKKLNLFYLKLRVNYFI